MRKTFILIITLLFTCNTLTSQVFYHKPNKKLKKLYGLWELNKEKSKRYDGDVDITEIEIKHYKSALSEFKKIYTEQESYNGKNNDTLNISFVGKGNLVFLNYDRDEKVKRELIFSSFNNIKEKALVYVTNRKNIFEPIFCSFYFIDKKNFVLDIEDIGFCHFTKK